MHLYADLPMWLSDRPDQLDIIREAVGILERAGFAGSLLFYTHDTLDPWVVATSTLHATTRHVPIIALQPYTIPPLTAAKMIHSMAHLFGRKVAVNMIPGQSRDEQQQVLNTVPSEERFDRLAEYAEVLRLLLTTDEPVTFSGKYYQYKNLQNRSKVSDELQPLIFMPGASPQFRKAALKTADVAIQLADPVSKIRESFGILYESQIELGCRIGLIARPSREEAILAAKEGIELRYLQILKKQRFREGEYTEKDMEIYYPTEKGLEFRGPLLIGSYDEVADYLQKYEDAGIKHLILSCIRDVHDMKHVQEVLNRTRFLAKV